MAINRHKTLRLTKTLLTWFMIIYSFGLISTYAPLNQREQENLEMIEGNGDSAANWES